jgi:hypothetical protein
VSRKILAGGESHFTKTPEVPSLKQYSAAADSPHYNHFLIAAASQRNADTVASLIHHFFRCVPRNPDYTQSIEVADLDA